MALRGPWRRNKWPYSGQLGGQTSFDTDPAKTYHCAPMSVEPLPEYLAPRRLARSGAKFAGEIPLARFRRFCADLPESGAAAGGVDGDGDGDGMVRVRLEFHVDDQGRTCVSGEMETSVRLTCQRCLGPVDLQLHCTLACAVVADDAAAASLPRSYEPLVLADERIALIDLLEDDLILGMPAQPRHAEGECEAPGRESAAAGVAGPGRGGAETGEAGTGESGQHQGPDAKPEKPEQPEKLSRENPFAKLESLRKKH